MRYLIVTALLLTGCSKFTILFAPKPIHYKVRVCSEVENRCEETTRIFPDKAACDVMIQRFQVAEPFLAEQVSLTCVPTTETTENNDGQG